MNKKFNSMQALRALACLCIYLYHCYVGNIVVWGVSVFFIMSGFLLTVNRFDKGDVISRSPVKALGFAWSKVKKLYPLYILALLPILALELYNIYTGVPDKSLLLTARELAASLLLLQSWIPQYSMCLNGVAWYLSTSLFLYFSFPYILSGIRKYTTRRTALVISLLLFSLELTLSLALIPLSKHPPLFFKHFSGDLGFEMWFTYIFPPFRLLDFSLGCNLGYLFVKRNKNISKTVIYSADAICLLLLTAAVLVYRLAGNWSVTKVIQYDVLFTPFCLLLVYIFALDSGWISKACTNRFTVFLGNISAMFFLIHQDIIRIIFMMSEYFGISFQIFRIVVIPSAFVLTILACFAYQKIAEIVKKRLS